jgi:hypothetical protein
MWVKSPKYEDPSLYFLSNNENSFVDTTLHSIEGITPIRPKSSGNSPQNDFQITSKSKSQRSSKYKPTSSIGSDAQVQADNTT